MNHSLPSEGGKKIIGRQLSRKLKIFLGVGFVGIIMIGALVIWAGIATIKGVANLAEEARVSDKVISLQKEMENIATLPKVDCWNTVQGLLNVEIWLESPIAENLQSLKLACMNTEKE